MDVKIKLIRFLSILMIVQNGNAQFLGILGENILFPPVYVVSHYPETGRFSDLHIYAINRFYSPGGEITFTKEGGLPSNAVESGLMTNVFGNFGCFLRVHGIKRRPGLRYGEYKARFSSFPFSGVIEEYAESTLSTFVKPKSDILNSRGVQTVTIYPETTESNKLSRNIQIGVSWSPGCRRITWCKGKRRNINTGPKLYLKTTEDAGLYTISRPRRSKRGFAVQILVTAATCPENFWYNDATSTCEEGSVNCENGGVLKDDQDFCMCPPLIIGTSCNCFVSENGDIFLLGTVNNLLVYGVTCGDLPDGDPRCKGHLFCLGGNYGCSCSPGWWGNACDRACPKGKWGAGCLQTCPESEGDCNRFYGPSSNLRKNGCVPYPELE